jgi:hypothetical protein
VCLFPCLLTCYHAHKHLIATHPHTPTPPRSQVQASAHGDAPPPAIPHPYPFDEEDEEDVDLRGVNTSIASVVSLDYSLEYSSDSPGHLWGSDSDTTPTKAKAPGERQRKVWMGPDAEGGEGEEGEDAALGTHL